MTKQYRIHVHGEQRDPLDIDLVVQLVVMMGRQLAEEAAERQRQAAKTKALDETAPTQEPSE